MNPTDEIRKPPRHGYALDKDNSCVIFTRNIWWLGLFDVTLRRKYYTRKYGY